MRILVIDNYDSFVYNIVHLLGQRKTDPEVVRNNRITVNDVKGSKPDAIIISPGPGHQLNRKYFGIVRTS